MKNCFKVAAAAATVLPTATLADVARFDGGTILNLVADANEPARVSWFDPAAWSFDGGHPSSLPGGEDTVFLDTSFLTDSVNLYQIHLGDAVGTDGTAFAGGTALGSRVTASEGAFIFDFDPFVAPGANDPFDPPNSGDASFGSLTVGGVKPASLTLQGEGLLDLDFSLVASGNLAGLTRDDIRLDIRGFGTQVEASGLEIGSIGEATAIVQEGAMVDVHVARVGFTGSTLPLSGGGDLTVTGEGTQLSADRFFVGSRLGSNLVVQDRGEVSTFGLTLQSNGSASSSVTVHDATLRLVDTFGGNAPLNILSEDGQSATMNVAGVDATLTVEPVAGGLSSLGMSSSGGGLAELAVSDGATLQVQGESQLFSGRQSTSRITVSSGAFANFAGSVDVSGPSAGVSQPDGSSQLVVDDAVATITGNLAVGEGRGDAAFSNDFVRVTGGGTLLVGNVLAVGGINPFDGIGSLAIESGFVSTGSLSIGIGSTVSVAADGTLDVGELSTGAAASSAEGTTFLGDSSLLLLGTLAADLTAVAGEIETSAAADSRIVGDVTLDATRLLLRQFVGRTALFVEGSLHAGGTIAIDQLPSNPYERRRLIDAESVSGTFTAVEAPEVSGPFVPAVTYSEDDVFVTVALAGDGNLDGIVNLADFTILRNNFGVVGGFANGDFNQNGIVDLVDFTLLRNTFGNASDADIAIMNAWRATVPEPTAVGVAGLAAAGLLRRKRRFVAKATAGATLLP
jgi:hypothetical protein